MGDRPDPLDMGGVQTPHYFRCPISLDLMADPVTISTGQTYDRESIESWVSAGNTTCPVTRTPLLSDFTLIPNHTLRRLIQHWCVSNPSSGHPRIPTPRRQPPHPSLFVSLLSQATSPSASPNARLSSLSRLSSYSSTATTPSPTHHQLQTLVSFLSDPLLSLPSLAVLAMFDLSETDCTNTLGSDPASLRHLVSFISHPTMDVRVNAATLIEMAASGELRAQFCASPDIFSGAVGLLESPAVHPEALKAGVRLLLVLCMVKRTRHRAVAAGCVEALMEALTCLDKSDTEKALATVQLLGKLPEGCARLTGQAMVVPLLVRTMLRVSEKATEHAAAALLLVCLESEGAQREAVGAGVVTQLLLLLQSGCSERAKRKATLLLKLFRDTSEYSMANSDDFGYSDVFLEA